MGTIFVLFNGKENSITYLAFVEEKDVSSKIKFFKNSIGAKNGYEIVAFDNQYDLIVDEEGALFERTPIFSVSIERFDFPIQIMGSFLIGKRVILEDGSFETCGFQSEDEAYEAFNIVDHKTSILNKTR